MNAIIIALIIWNVILTVLVLMVTYYEELHRKAFSGGLQEFKRRIEELEAEK